MKIIRQFQVQLLIKNDFFRHFHLMCKNTEHLDRNFDFPIENQELR